jgi:peptidoglycan/LPS O-acetylase OafA/YrhL
MDSRPSENIALTSIRGLLALWVVGFHWFLKTDNVTLNAWFGQAYLAVDLFFILSGLILTDIYKSQTTFINPYHFYLKRILRVWPVHLLSMAILTVIVIFPEFDFTWNLDYSLSLLFFQSFFQLSNVVNPPAWSISVEWVCYLFFPFLLLFLIHGFKFQSVRVLVLLTAPFVLYWIDLHYGVEISAPGAVFRAMASFSYGMVISLWAERLQLSALASNVLFGLGLSLMLFFLVGINLSQRAHLHEDLGPLQAPETRIVGMIEHQASHAEIAKTMDDQHVSVHRLSVILNAPEIDIQRLYNESNPSGVYYRSLFFLRLQQWLREFHFAASIPLLGGFVLLALQSQRGFFPKILSTPWIHHLGKISFSVYLMHFPLLVFFQKVGFYSPLQHLQLDSIFAFKVCVMLMTLWLVSTLSFHCIENPARRLGRWILSS